MPPAPALAEEAGSEGHCEPSGGQQADLGRVARRSAPDPSAMRHIRDTSLVLYHGLQVVPGVGWGMPATSTVAQGGGWQQRASMDTMRNSEEHVRLPWR